MLGATLTAAAAFGGWAVASLPLFSPQKVTVAELAQLLNGKNPKHRGRTELRPPAVLGFWLRYSIDTVRSLDQQYQP